MFYCANLRAESTYLNHLLTRLSTGFVGNLLPLFKTITYVEIALCGAQICALVNMKIYFFKVGMHPYRIGRLKAISDGSSDSQMAIT